MPKRRGKMTKTPTDKAEKYIVGGQYRFLFVVFDDTPGGGNLGRIMFRLEPIAEEGDIVKLFLQVRQTRDKRYDDKTFELEVGAPSIFGNALGTNDFLSNTWRTYYCPEHKTFALEAYPQDHHNVLVFERFSGVGIQIRFETE